MEKVSDGLSGEAKCVAVSARRWVNVYAVSGDNPVNIGDDWYVPLVMLYSPPGMASKMMVVLAALANVGAAGVSCVALVMVAVAEEVMVPVQFEADTSTDMASPMSFC